MDSLFDRRRTFRQGSVKLELDLKLYSRKTYLEIFSYFISFLVLFFLSIVLLRDAKFNQRLRH